MSLKLKRRKQDEKCQLANAAWTKTWDLTQERKTRREGRDEKKIWEET